ncbi:MAG: winged helix DNA-binding protein [Bacteroidales bacterium]|nr:winged helix DNA-binding protein [Bacteroidales bacterium]
MSSIITKMSYLAGVTRFRRISEKLYVDGDKIYRAAGIEFKASWFPVYFVLALTENPVTVMQIADQIDFSHITVKNVIRELEKQEYVEIISNPADGRSKLISLSKKGQKLIYRLKPIWMSISITLKKVFQTGHPDFMNILNRIDSQIEKNPLHLLVAQTESDTITVIDYKPGLERHFHELAGPWLSGEVNSQLEEKEGITLQSPDPSCFLEGGFLFFARYKGQIVGFVALKRLDNERFEFARLYTNPVFNNLEIDLKLIERCICRCMENEARELWHQTILDIPEAHILFHKLGFIEKEAPPGMQLSDQTGKVICLEF